MRLDDVTHRLDVATHQLHRLAQAQARFRVERAQKTTATDKLICRQLNGLKSAERAKEVSDFKNLDRNLRILGITKTPEIVQIATRDHRRTLRQLRPANCDKLPSASKVGLPK